MKRPEQSRGCGKSTTIIIVTTFPHLHGCGTVAAHPFFLGPTTALMGLAVRPSGARCADTGIFVPSFQDSNSSPLYTVDEALLLRSFLV